MMWLAWRQFRAQSVVAAAALAAFAVILGVTGPHLANLYGSSGLARCHANCATLYVNFMSQVKSDAVYPFLFFLGAGVLIITPGLIGIFWGAPLVTRELEAGTFRLAWTQSVTRTRWLAIKLGLTGLAAMATAGLLSLMITWWVSPIDRAGGFPDNMSQFSRFSPLMFAARGVAPIGYAAFAFALGVTAGVFIRRILPAMAITLAIFAAVQIIMPNWIRPHLIAPDYATETISAVELNSQGFAMSSNGAMTVPLPDNLPGAWITSNQTVTTAGHVFTLPIVGACQSGTQQSCDAWIGSQHLRQVIAYQPASRFWAFQWYEAGIFIVLALVISGFCYWRVRRLS